MAMHHESAVTWLALSAIGLAAPGTSSGPAAEAVPQRSAALSTLPGLRKLMDTPLRDTSICRGPDGTWYLTGTVEPFWAYNEEIKLWKSKDLVTWEPLGLVWKYGASPWHQPYLEKKKPRFQDERDRWWSSFFGSDPRAPWQERPGILPVGFGGDGRIRPVTAPGAAR